MATNVTAAYQAALAKHCPQGMFHWPGPYAAGQEITRTVDKKRILREKIDSGEYGDIRSPRCIGFSQEILVLNQRKCWLQRKLRLPIH